MNGKSYNINGKLGMNGVMKPSWNGQLYDTGNEFIWKTGGWLGYALTPVGGTNPFAPTLTKNATNMVGTLYFPGTKRYGTIFMLNPIDLTPYTKLKMNFSCVIPFTNAAVSILTTPSMIQNYTVSSSAIQSTTVSNATLEIDISALNSMQYIGAGIVSENTATGTITLTITKIWLE